MQSKVRKAHNRLFLLNLRPELQSARARSTRQAYPNYFLSVCRLLVPKAAEPSREIGKAHARLGVKGGAFPMHSLPR